MNYTHAVQRGTGSREEKFGEERRELYLNSESQSIQSWFSREPNKVLNIYKDLFTKKGKIIRRIMYIQD